MICPHSIHPLPRLRKEPVLQYSKKRLPCLELRNFREFGPSQVLGSVEADSTETKSTVDSYQTSFVKAFLTFMVSGSISDLIAKVRARERWRRKTYHVKVGHLLSYLLCLVLAAFGRVTCTLGGSCEGKRVCDACRSIAGWILGSLRPRWGSPLGLSHLIYLGRVNLLMLGVLPSHVYSTL